MKYVGSKARHAPEFMPVLFSLAPDTQHYVEPFAGGMNCAAHIPEGVTRQFSDNHLDLIMMWQALSRGWVPPYITKNQYKQLRHARPSALRGYAGFVCSFRAKWFGGMAHTSVTADGTFRNYQRETRAKLLDQVPELVGAEIVHSDYTEVSIPSKSIVYCDPPYANTIGYGASFDTDMFWDWVRNQSRRPDVHVFVSEYAAPKDFKSVWRKAVPTHMATGNASMVMERVFTYAS